MSLPTLGAGPPVAGGLISPTALPGADVWLSSASGTYSDAGGTTPAAAGEGIAAWRDSGPANLLLLQSDYGGGFFGKPTLRTDNGHPVVESRTTANGQAALFADLGAAWTPTDISVHWLARMRPGSAEQIQLGFGLNATTGMRSAGIWDIGCPLLSTNTPFAKCYSPWCADGAYHLTSYVREGGNSRVYYDGVPIANNSPADATTKSDVNTVWVCGFRHNDVQSRQYVADGWVYRAAHTDAQVAALAAWCQSNRSLIYPKTTTPSPDVFVYFIGNSIWTTNWTGFPSLPTRASTGQSSWSRWCNASLGGQATAGGGTSNNVGMVARLDTEYGPVLARRPEATKVAVIFELTNDMALTGSTPAQAYANYVTLADGLRAKGASKVVAVTCLPRPQISESDRDAVNALVVADAAGAFDGVCPIHTNEDIGLAGTNENATLYHIDQIHLRSAGATVFAPVLRAAIESALSQ